MCDDTIPIVKEVPIVKEQSTYFIVPMAFILYSTSHGDCALGRVFLADLGA